MSEEEQEVTPAVPDEVDAPELVVCHESYEPQEHDKET